MSGSCSHRATLPAKTPPKIGNSIDFFIAIFDFFFFSACLLKECGYSKTTIDKEFFYLYTKARNENTVIKATF